MDFETLLHEDGPGRDVTGKVASTDACSHGEQTGEPTRLGPVRTGVRRDKPSLDQVIVTWP